MSGDYRTMAEEARRRLGDMCRMSDEELMRRLQDRDAHLGRMIRGELHRWVWSALTSPNISAETCSAMLKALLDKNKPFYEEMLKLAVEDSP